uniref:Uncharacterized protein n=1 Tax=Rhabditophanes sp. KR3021 TaxID=114890 RepID=A0AC35U758_9BILA
MPSITDDPYSMRSQMDDTTSSTITEEIMVTSTTSEHVSMNPDGEQSALKQVDGLVPMETEAERDKLEEEATTIEPVEPATQKPPTIFEEMFIDTLTKEQNKDEFETNFTHPTIEESFETLITLCGRFRNHFRFFCRSSLRSPENELRCKGYLQDCGQFIKPRNPLSVIAEKYQTNILRGGYYDNRQKNKEVSPFV